MRNYKEAPNKTNLLWSDYIAAVASIQHCFKIFDITVSQKQQQEAKKAIISSMIIVNDEDNDDDSIKQYGDCFDSLIIGNDDIKQYYCSFIEPGNKLKFRKHSHQCDAILEELVVKNITVKNR